MKVDPRFCCTWIVQKKQESDIPYNQQVRVKSLQSIYTFIRAKVIVTNTEVPSYIPYRSNQIIINTWHGGGAFKKISQKNFGKAKWYEDKITDIQTKNISAFISSSEIMTELVLKGYFNYSGRVLPFGSPRNDILFTKDKEITNDIKTEFNIPQEDGVILYAPTFRGGWVNGSIGQLKNNPLDVELFVNTWNKRTGRKHHLIYRGHHAMKEGLNFCQFIDATKYSDMQKLLLIADVLISDYSSCMWDYCMTYRPCFMYAPDLSDYILSPGLYSDYKEWPFILFDSNLKIERVIESFDNTKYIAKVEKYLSLYGSYEKGNACKQVLEYIGSQLNISF